MPVSEVTRAFVKHSGVRLCQGDIFRDLIIDINKQSATEEKDLLVIEYPLPYSVLITQDCDLEQDYDNRINSMAETQDKYILNMLLLPAYPAQKLRTGSQFKGNDDDDNGLTMRSLNSDEWRIIKNNRNIRYHFIEGDNELQIPDLAIDFKHYTTVPHDYLYEIAKKTYRATITTLFREDISNRFTHYLSRIALPELKRRIEIQT